jgi:D-alanyl-D-alanine carboxypeptidase
MPTALRTLTIDPHWLLATALATLLGVACARPPAPPGASSLPVTAKGAGDAPEAEALAAAVSQPVAEPSRQPLDAPVRPTESALRNHLDSLQRGEPNFADMLPELAEAIRSQPGPTQTARELGPVQSMLFRGVGPRGADIYEVTSQNGFSEWRIMLAPDGKIAMLRFRIVEKPPSAPLSDEEFITELSARVRSAAADEQFSGAVLVARANQPIFQVATGLADRELEQPNTLQTKFRIASMSKMFTAVAILQLVQAGKLALSDPLAKILPDYPNADAARQVTIEHLLTHTGGTGDIFGPEFFLHRRELRELRDYVTLFGHRGLEFPPGSRWEYSNFGFVLLGVVIERVSGQSYYDYVARHVYAPAGMRNTGSFAEDQRVAGRSIGYTRFRPEGSQKPKPAQVWFPNTSSLPYRGSSAGGAYSTVGDLLAFANALEQHRLLDAAHTELLTTKKPLSGAAGYAYGFMDETIAGVRCVGHNGGGAGMSGFLRICQPPGAPSSFVIAILSNQDPPAAPELGDFVRVRLPTAPAAAADRRACNAVDVDDLEDGDVRATFAGVDLEWQSYHDLTGSTLSPSGPFVSASGGPEGSKRAAHISGRTAPVRETWAGIELRPTTSGQSLDLSAWSAICFKVRGTGYLRFGVADASTDPGGGVCKSCYNHFGANIELGPAFREHCLAFDDLTQQWGWGEPYPALGPGKVFGVNWSVNAPAAAYDLWVDDVRLVCQ